MARHIVLVLMLAVAPSACGNDGSDPAPDAAADAGDTAVDVGDTARDVGDTALDGDVGACSSACLLRRSTSSSRPSEP